MDFSKIEETREENQKPEDNLVFHYNREERLKRAPKIVQDYYSGNFKPYKGGLLKSLVATRGNRLLFCMMLVFFTQENQPCDVYKQGARKSEYSSFTLSGGAP